MKSSFVFTFIMAVVAAIIGAGFVSGKEIVSFFGGLGYYSLILLIPLAFLFYIVFFVFAKLGKEIKPQSISGLTSAMFGKTGMIVDFGFIIATFITLSSMLAGSDSIGQIMFGSSYNFCYISILTVMIVTIIVFYGLKYIYKITDFILPVMLILVVFVILTFLISKPQQNVTEEFFNKNIFSSSIYLFLYVFMNTFSNTFIISKTSQYMNKKQIKIASLITAVILSMFVGLILIAVLHGGNEVFISDMPMLAVANSIGSVFGITYAVVLWLAIFTTICISAYTIVQWLNIYIKNKFLSSVTTLTLGFIFSRFGFATIVEIFYPIEGIFGEIFIIYAIVFYFKNKNRFFAKEKLEYPQHLKSITVTKNGPNIKVKKQYLQRTRKKQSK